MMVAQTHGKRNSWELTIPDISRKQWELIQMLQIFQHFQAHPQLYSASIKTIPPNLPPKSYYLGITYTNAWNFGGNLIQTIMQDLEGCHQTAYNMPSWISFSEDNFAVVSLLAFYIFWTCCHFGAGKDDQFCRLVCSCSL